MKYTSLGCQIKFVKLLFVTKLLYIRTARKKTKWNTK